VERAAPRHVLEEAAEIAEAQREVALEERAAVDGALALVREDGATNAWGALHRSMGRPEGILLPRGDQGLSPTAAQVGVGEHDHRAGLL
jgi:hypothetical protein